MGPALSVKAAIVRNIEVVEDTTLLRRKVEVVLIQALDHVRFMRCEYIHPSGAHSRYQRLVHGVFVQVEAKGHAGLCARTRSASSRSASVSSAARSASTDPRLAW